MSDLKREKLKVGSQRAFLVSVLDSRDQRGKERALDEMKGLIQTAGAEVVGEMVQLRDHPDPATCLGSGKLVELTQAVADCGADLIVFDNHLTPSQGKTVEQETGTQVVDRSEVILDIFATHARTFQSAVGFQLLLAGAFAAADPALDAFEVGPHAGQSRLHVEQLGQLDLQLRFKGTGMRGEDIEDDLAAVDDLRAGLLFDRLPL